MSLRSKVLLLFAFLAVAPILAIGVLDYLQSISALGELVKSKMETAAERSAREFADRYRELGAELAALGANPAMRQLAGSPEWDEAGRAAAVVEVESHYRAVWPDLRRRFVSVELQDASGRPLHRIADDEAVSAQPAACPEAPPGWTLSRSVPAASGGEVGRLVALPRLEALDPARTAGFRFGTAGYTALLDRSTGLVLYSQRCEQVGRPAALLLGEAADIVPALGEPRRGRLELAGLGAPRFGVYVSLDSPPWTVLTTADLDEFIVPYGKLRLVHLLVVLLIAAGAAGAFSILTRGLMRSLKQLSRAADQIGKGEMQPWLPPPGNDEVGRLSLALATMAEKIRVAMRQIERSRQTAVLGRMASYLAHEIRNPLNSIRLNLQMLARDAKSGRISEDQSEMLDLCLREVARLNNAVHGVVTLGRIKAPQRRPCPVHDVVRDAVTLTEPQFRRKGITVDLALLAPRDRALVDADQVRGILLNLLLNASEAMPAGGCIRVWSDIGGGEAGEAPVLVVRVRDEGPGVPPEIRHRIFEPFFSTRPSGSGIGLAVSVQNAEENGGALLLESDGSPEPGAEFVLTLPLVQNLPAGIAEPGSPFRNGAGLPHVVTTEPALDEPAPDNDWQLSRETP